MKTQTYTIKVTEDEDGNREMHRRNDGFSPLELIGIADLIKFEICEQLKGLIKCDVVKREVIKD